MHSLHEKRSRDGEGEGEFFEINSLEIIEKRKYEFSVKNNEN